MLGCLLCTHAIRQRCCDAWSRGEEIEVLRDNRRVAKIIPLSRRRQWPPAAKIGHELARLGPDTTGLADELRAVLAETTDDLAW